MTGGQGTRADLAYRTIPGLLAERAAKMPDRPALVDGEVTLTFVSLAGRVRAVAKALIGSSIEPGDRVAIWAPNMWEWVVVALGVHSAGGVVVPINTRYKGHRWRAPRSAAPRSAPAQCGTDRG
jgi:acyl-CoA synthetase (AMP-forming)/AMP-acid ligase II